MPYSTICPIITNKIIFKTKKFVFFLAVNKKGATFALANDRGL